MPERATTNAAVVVLLVVAGCASSSTLDTRLDAAADVDHVDLAGIDLGHRDLGPPDAGPHCTGDRDCNDGLFCNGVEGCTSGSPATDARGCFSGTPPCVAPMICNEATTLCDCVDGVADADSDGHVHIACGGDDCNDGDPSAYPGNREICDTIGHDEDCNPATLGPDVDGDGFVSTACCNVQPSGALVCGVDCDDTRATVNPSAPEICNGIDDNCNLMIDEGGVCP